MTGPAQAIAAGVLVAVAACAADAHATGAPLILAPLYAEPSTSAPALKPDCAVRFTALVDQRHDPSIVGIVGRRAVASPADVQAWLRSILGGLARRGIALRFDAADSAVPDPAPVAATFNLDLAWIMPVGLNYSANVVFGIDGKSAHGTAFAATYRGRSAHTDWFNGDGEKVGALNAAIADALDKIATDLRQQCRG